MSRASYRQAHEDWQIRKYRTLERTKHLLETGLYADCEFLVGADESDKEVSTKFHFKYNPYFYSNLIVESFLYRPLKLTKFFLQ